MGLFKRKKQPEPRLAPCPKCAQQVPADALDCPECGAVPARTSATATSGC